MVPQLQKPGQMLIPKVSHSSHRQGAAVGQIHDKVYEQMGETGSEKHLERSGDHLGSPHDKYAGYLDTDDVGADFVLKIPCHLCGTRFKTFHGLRLHHRKHHQDTPTYRCEICGRGFMMKGHYVGHMNMHNNVRSFECPNCPKKFAYKSSLKTHMKECG